MKHRILHWLTVLSLALPLLATETWDLEGDSVDHAGTKENDWFLLSQDAHLGGTYLEDLWVFAQKIRFTGTAEDDVRLVGIESLSVEGPIQGDLSAVAWAGNMLVSTNAVIESSANLQGNKRITLRGTFKGDVFASAPKVVVQGDIRGSLTVDAGEIQLLPGTRIEGNLISTHERDLPIPQGVELVGEQEQITNATTQVDDMVNQWFLIIRLVQLLSSLLVGLLLLRLVPRFLGQAVDLAMGLRGPCMGVGALTLLVGGSAGLLFLSTFYAAGTGIFLLGVTGLLFYVGQIVIALALGATLLRSKQGFTFGRLSLALFVWLLILSILFSVAFIGMALYLFVSCWGMGALVLAIRNSQQPLQASFPPPIPKQNPTSPEDPS